MLLMVDINIDRNIPMIEKSVEFWSHTWFVKATNATGESLPSDTWSFNVLGRFFLPIAQKKFNLFNETPLVNIPEGCCYYDKRTVSNPANFRCSRELPSKRSIVRIMGRSSRVTSVRAVPCLAMRPVRPIRWVYASAVSGIS